MTVHGPLHGQYAVITGGSRGIGAGISRRLAALGAHVIINYVERDAPAQALCEELRAAGAGADVFRADIGDPADVAALVAFVATRTPRLDMLILNAGATVFRAAHEYTPAHVDWVWRTNVGSVFTLVQGFLPALEGHDARIVTLSNGSAVRHLERNALFGAAKAALEQLTRSLAVELAPRRIRANCVRPGTVATAVLDVRPDFKERLERERARTNGVTTVEDCAAAVASLCLPDLARVNGQVLIVDGGASL